MRALGTESRPSHVYVGRVEIHTPGYMTLRGWVEASTKAYQNLFTTEEGARAWATKFRSKVDAVIDLDTGRPVEIDKRVHIYESYTNWILV